MVGSIEGHRIISSGGLSPIEAALVPIGLDAHIAALVSPIRYYTRWCPPLRSSFVNQGAPTAEPSSATSTATQQQEERLRCNNRSTSSIIMSTGFETSSSHISSGAIGGGLGEVRRPRPPRYQSSIEVAMTSS
jgi:hypothetical protein